MENTDTLYSRWLSGELSPSEIKDLKASGEWEELEAIIKATDSLSLPKMDLDASFEALKKQKLKSVTKVRRLPLNWVYGIAAGVVLLVSIIFLLRNQADSISADFATNVVHVFKDQSRVILNDGSSINFADEKWEIERIVNLQGEAFFEVEPGSPFKVETDNGSIQVLGTQFNVRAWGTQFYVECYEGKVMVAYQNQDTILVASQSVLIDKGTMLAVNSINNKEPLWTLGISRFFDEDIKEVFQELERQFDVEVNFSSSLNRSFTGSFDHNDLNSAIQKICKPLGIDYSFSNDNKTIFIDTKG